MVLPGADPLAFCFVYLFCVDFCTLRCKIVSWEEPGSECFMSKGMLGCIMGDECCYEL